MGYYLLLKSSRWSSIQTKIKNFFQKKKKKKKKKKKDLEEVNSAGDE